MCGGVAVGGLGGGGLLVGYVNSRAKEGELYLLKSTFGTH